MLSQMYFENGMQQVYPGETTFKTCVESKSPSIKKSLTIFLVFLFTRVDLMPGFLYSKYFF